VWDIPASLKISPASRLVIDQVFTAEEKRKLPDCASWMNFLTCVWTMPTRVLLADDHALIRQGLKALLETQGFQVVGEASDGQESLHLAEKTRPDVAILDISMPVLNGVDAARQLKKISPNVKIVLLTQHDEDQYVTEALRVGAKGYVLKSQAANDLVQAIREVCRGSVYLSPSISRTVVDAYVSKTYVSTDPLSGRERQVLQLVGEGKSTKDVAMTLGISVKTAESHRARLMKKLDIHETASLVRYAIRRGLIQP
jgi:two-component system, NarL family, response regulator NreC